MSTYANSLTKTCQYKKRKNKPEIKGRTVFYENGRFFNMGWSGDFISYLARNTSFFKHLHSPDYGITSLSVEELWDVIEYLHYMIFDKDEKKERSPQERGLLLNILKVIRIDHKECVNNGHHFHYYFVG